jgi:hypothetical protein
MSNSLNKPLLILLLAIGTLNGRALAQTNQSPSTASDEAIQGRVLNDQGEPVFGATVVAIPEGPWDGMVPMARTDRRGRFLFPRMSPRGYGLYAFKEGKASRTISAHHFSNDPRVLRLTAQEHQTIKGLELQLLPKQATVSGQFVDSETGRPVEPARLKLCHLGECGILRSR